MSTGVDTAPAPEAVEAVEVGWNRELEVVEVVRSIGGDVYDREWTGLGGPCSSCGRERGRSGDATLSGYCLPCLYGPIP